MKSSLDKLITCVLTPVSWIYGAVMWTRNKMFDNGMLTSTEYDVPVVGVGNITVGGTGKTPHVEYIASMLASRYRIAVLSRGYKRKTRGFVLANSRSTPDILGDEPMQIYNKYGHNVKVAVCENRRRGITELLKLFPDLDLILLDDSFQHRWVKPKVSVLLLDYNRPVHKDHLLPLGRLREPVHSLYRADMVIITKCPEQMSPLDYRLKSNELGLMNFQKLYFSGYGYGPLSPVFPDDAPYSASLSSLSSRDSVLLLTGIAYPRHFVNHFRSYPFKVKVSRFPDHHDFSREDIADIRKQYDAMKGERKIILTTEKDAVRLSYNPYFPKELKPFVFYQPIAVEFRDGIESADFIGDLTAAIERGK